MWEAHACCCLPTGPEDSSQSGGETADEAAAAAAAAEAEVMAAAESVLTANGRIPGGHFVDMAELRRLIRQARDVSTIASIYFEQPCMYRRLANGRT